MSEEKLTCPECGSEEVCTGSIQMFYANTGEHYCHSVKTHDSNSPAFCIECCWRGERHQLVAAQGKEGR